MEDFTLTRNGIPLAATFHPGRSDARLAFVVTHGWGSQRPTDIPAALAAEGFPTIAHDLRGHGASGGSVESASREDWVDDLVAFIDELRAQVPGLPIGLVGASFGAYLSLVAAADHDVACLALRVPANYVDEGFEKPHVAGMLDPGPERDRLLTPSDSYALATLRAFRGPVHIVDADGDTVIPARTIADYAAAADPARLTRHTLRDAPHHLANDALRAEYMGVLISWARGVSRMDA